MQTKNVTYQIKVANENDVLLHLNRCNDFFIPPLNSKVDLAEYSKKIYHNAITFEAWSGQNLIGLIAAYFNYENKFGFITNVSAVKDYIGEGVASKLILMCIDYANLHNYKEIKLEVFKDNTPAIKFYTKHNFKQIETKNDSLIMNLILKQ